MDAPSLLPEEPRRKRRRFRAVRNALFYPLVLGAAAALKCVPLEAGLRIGAALGGAAWFLLPRTRRRMRAHLRLAFPRQAPGWRDAVARRALMNLGKSFFELLHLREILRGVKGKGRFVGYIQWEGRERFEAVLARGRGGLMATGHIGNWELMAAATAAAGFPAHAVVRRLFDPRIDRLVNDFRAAHGYMPIKRDGVAGAREIFRVLRHNGFVGLLMDQDTKVRGEWVPFFGVLAHTPVGPAVLAYQAKLDANIATIHRRPEGGHIITVSPPIPRPETGDKDGDIRAYTAVLTRALEDRIRSHPDEWVWMHRRWKKRPPGEAKEENPQRGRET